MDRDKEGANTSMDAVLLTPDVTAVDRVLVALTGRCNLDCAYCFQKLRNPARISSDSLRGALGLALSAGACRTDLVLSGGEPLLEFGLLRRVVDYIEARRTLWKEIRLVLSTNGLLLSPGVADFLQSHRFTVQLSFDGIAAAQGHRGANTFNVLDGRLDLLRSACGELFQNRLQIAMTVIPATVPFMADSVSYFLEKGVRELSIAPCITHFPGWQPSDISVLEKQAADIAGISGRHLDRTGEVPVRMFTNHGGGGRRLCGALRGSSLAIDADGEVYGCPFFAKSCQDLHAASGMRRVRVLRMGNVGDPALAGRRAAAIRAARGLLSPDWQESCRSSYGRCGECPYYTACFICPVSIWSMPGRTDALRIPDFICAFNRVMLQQRATFRGRKACVAPRNTL